VLLQQRARGAQQDQIQEVEAQPAAPVAVRRDEPRANALAKPAGGQADD